MDGIEGKKYDLIGAASLIFSIDSRHVAYPAEDDDTWCVVVNEEEGKQYNVVRVGSLIFSNDNLRYITADKDANLVNLYLVEIRIE